jgi:tetratricopeptide (TPR) repeat protein
MIDSTKVAARLAEVLAKNPVESECLRHESSATINRSNLVGAKDSPLLQLNTRQLAWIVVQQAASTPDMSGSAYLRMLGVSAMIAGDQEILDAINAAVELEELYPWLKLIHSFEGTPAQFEALLQSFPDPRQAIAACCVGCRQQPILLTERMLVDLAQPSTITGYLELLRIGLSGPNARALSSMALETFISEPEMLFAGDVDQIIAGIIRSLDHQNLDEQISPLLTAFGDYSWVALAEYHIAQRNWERALTLSRRVRFLSPARPLAARTAAIGALEIGDHKQALACIEEVEDEVMSLRLLCRLFQDTGDRDAFIRTIAKLYSLTPDDVDTFVQFTLLLLQAGEIERAQRLCENVRPSILSDDRGAQVIAQVMSLKSTSRNTSS